MTGLPGFPGRAEGPTIYWSAEHVASLRSVASIRRAVESGWHATMYGRIREIVDAETNSAPLTPSTPLEGRDPAAVAGNSPDFVITNAAGQRMLRAALTTFIENDELFRNVAL